MKDRRIRDKRDRTVTTSWSVSTGIWFSASLVWRWRWLPGAGATGVEAPPPMASTRRGGGSRGGARGGEVAARGGGAARARRLVARAARFFGESRPSGGRGALGRGCPSENEKRRGVVGCGVRPPAPGSAAGTLLSTADSAGSLCCSIYRAVKEAHEMGWAN